MYLTPQPPRSRLLPGRVVLTVVIAGVILVVLAGVLVAGFGPDSFPGREPHEAGRPQDIDPARFALVRVGMLETQVVELLGLPSESRGPQTEPIRVPDILNPEECSGHIPCQCEGPVKELFYYRGSLGESLFVYTDRAGMVCCYQRTHSMRMSMTSF